MKVIVAGCRHFAHPADYNLVVRAIHESGFPISEIVSGNAKGIDTFAIQYATENSIPLKRFYPDWRLGPWAGNIRNKRMADYGEALVAVWDGRSKGTRDMINKARFARLPVYVLDAGL